MLSLTPIDNFFQNLYKYKFVETLDFSISKDLNSTQRVYKSFNKQLPQIKMSEKLIIFALCSLVPLLHAISVPYQASLENNGNYVCGGAILTHSTFLTAAHCVQGKDPKEYSIRGGTLKLGKGGQVVQVKEFRIHPNYDNKTLDNNLAIVISQTPFPSVQIATEAVEGIDIADDNENLEGKTGIASGWGYTEKSEGQMVLVFLDMPILSRSVCEEHVKMTNHMMCGGFLEGGKGMSDEDAGSPLVVDGELVGITCKAGNGKANKPDIFTDVRTLRSWIQENTQK